MVSTAQARVRWPRRTGFALLPHLGDALGLTALGLLIFLAIVFAARRLAGGFQQPLDGASLVAAAALLCCAVIAISYALPSKVVSTPYSVLRTQYLAVGGASAASIILLAALTFADSEPWAVVIAWFALACGEAASWRLVFRRAYPPRVTRPPVAPVRYVAETEAAESIPANLHQQLTRVREADGSESIHVMARAEVPTGDRLAVLHLALCPPLEGAPQLTAHAIDAEDADVRITAAETYGLRLEVRLAVPAPQPRQVLIEVLGRASVADSLHGDVG